MVCFGEMFCCANENRMHIRFALHILHLIVQTGLENESISHLFEKIRFFCKKIHSSSRLVQFLDSQEGSNDEPKINVVLDVKTRWNSTHEMIKTALRIKKSLTSTSVHICSQGNITYNQLDDNDWLLAEKICLLLEPFNQGNLKLKPIKRFFFKEFLI